MTIRLSVLAAAAVLALSAASATAQSRDPAAKAPPRATSPVGQPMVTVPADQAYRGPGSDGQQRAGSRAVRDAQTKLAEMGHDPGPRDGVMGPRTRDAVRAFQQAKGMEVTGELDGRTKDALGLGRM